MQFHMNPCISVFIETFVTNKAPVRSYFAHLTVTLLTSFEALPVSICSHETTFSNPFSYWSITF